MILTAFFPTALPVRDGEPARELAIEGNGRRGRDVGNDGAFGRFRGLLEVPLEARGDDTNGRAAVALRVEGPADMVIVAVREMR